jgi:CTP synthase
MKYIVVTGGVISGLGKGVAISSLGHILKLHGVDLTIVKLDPYLNVDAGTMSPFEHGECYVLDDGGEVDLDFGTYERMMGITLSSENSITSGKVYQTVLGNERKGIYLGKTVQIVPHITNEVIHRIESAGKNRGYPVCLIELGGTVGDIESAVFLESLRQLRMKVGRNNFCHIHLSLIPIVNEQKSKPTQHSYKELRPSGLSPDFIFCRCEKKVEQSIKDKISLFCSIPSQNVISLHDVNNIYRVPALLQSQDVGLKVLERLNIPIASLVAISPFSRISEFKESITISVIGKYSKLQDAYISVVKSIFHACHHHNVKGVIDWKDAEKINSETTFGNCIIVPGGFGTRGSVGKIRACRYARENNIPFLGICFGFQLAVIEYLRSVHNKNVSTEEISRCESDAIINMYRGENLGGTMMKGLKSFSIKRGTKLRDIYNSDDIFERCRHRYEVNRDIVDSILEEDKEWVWSCEEENGRYESFELVSHPFYVGVQYHPEYLSRFTKPSPLFLKLIETSKYS